MNISRVDDRRKHRTGWDIQGVHVHPVSAYTSGEYWLSNFEALFPDKAKRMREYSRKAGWHRSAHISYWYAAVLRWLNKNV